MAQSQSWRKLRELTTMSSSPIWSVWSRTIRATDQYVYIRVEYAYVNKKYSMDFFYVHGIIRIPFKDGTCASLDPLKRHLFDQFSYASNSSIFFFGRVSCALWVLPHTSPPPPSSPFLVSLMPPVSPPLLSVFSFGNSSLKNDGYLSSKNTYYSVWSNILFHEFFQFSFHLLLINWPTIIRLLCSQITLPISLMIC